MVRWGQATALWPRSAVRDTGPRAGRHRPFVPALPRVEYAGPKRSAVGIANDRASTAPSADGAWSYRGTTSPVSYATLTSWARSCTPSFISARATCVFTVAVLRCKWAAICTLLKPWATSAMT